MKKILLSTIATISIASASTIDAQNLLNFLSQDMNFKCENTTCISKSFSKTEKDGRKITIDKVSLLFKDSSSFDFTFDKDKEIKKVEEKCKDKSSTKIVAGCEGPNCLTEKDSCLQFEMGQATIDVSKKLTSGLKEINIDNFQTFKNGKEFYKVENLKFAANDNLITLGQMNVDKITKDNLNLSADIYINKFSIPAQKEALIKGLSFVLPNDFIVSFDDNMNLQKTTLATVENLNKKYIEMYSIIFDSFLKKVSEIKKDFAFSFVSKVNGDKIDITVSLKSKTEDGYAANAEIDFEISNIDSSIQVIKTLAKNPEDQGALMALMGLAQNVGFKDLEFDTNLSVFKQISDELSSSNKEFVAIRSEIKNILNSKDFEEETKTFNSFQLFTYKALLLDSNKAEFLVKNKNKTPLMMLFMSAKQGQDISTILDIETKFSK